MQTALPLNDNIQATVLIVDDDTDLLELTSLLVQAAGFEIILATTGQECLDQIHEHQPDLVLLDVRLPDMSGFDVCRQIKADPKLNTIFVVFVSASLITSEAQTTGLQAGADGYIARPVSNNELVARVQTLMRLKKTEDALRRAKDELELRVAERTAELAKANKSLKQEFAERKQVTSQLQFQAYLLANVNDAIIAIDRQLNIIHWNLAAEKLYGWKAEEVMGKRMQDVARTELSDSERQKILKSMDKTASYRTEVVQYHKDGQPIHIEAVTHVLRNEQGEITGYVALNRDITQRKRAEEEINRRNRELTVLLEVSRQLSSQLQTDELLSKITQSIVDIMPVAEGASLWLYDEQQHKLVAHAWSGHPNEALADLAVEPDKSLVGLVYQTCSPQIVDDTTTDPAFEELGRPEIDRIRSLIGVPMVAEGQVIGLLFADNFSQPFAFNEADIGLLQSLASQAVIAIQNARLLDRVMKHERELGRLSSELLKAQEAERKRISQELHDAMGQSLTAISLNLGLIRNQLPASLEPKIIDRLAETSELASQTLTQIRELSLDLRPSMLDELGLQPTLRWYVNRYAKRLSVNVEFEVAEFEERLGAETETAIYRIVQEAFTNISKHADASKVTLRLTKQDNAIMVKIVDNGRGFDVNTVAGRPVHERGLGLVGIRERVGLLGGTVNLQSHPGQGTDLTLHIPFAE